MAVTITGKKIVLELPKEEFAILEPEAIEKEVLNGLRKLKATKDFFAGKISEREVVRILGPEKALNIIEAKKITEKSIKRAIDEQKEGGDRAFYMRLPL